MQSEHLNVTLPVRSDLNGNPMKKLTHILVTLTFAFSCFGLWAMLHLLSTVPTHSHALPAFTLFIVGMHTWLLLLPVPLMAYCAYVLLRRPAAEHNGTAFLACSLSALSLVFFPVLLALSLAASPFRLREVSQAGCESMMRRKSIPKTVRRSDCAGYERVILFISSS